jgi:hypothetical protein
MASRHDSKVTPRKFNCDSNNIDDASAFDPTLVETIALATAITFDKLDIDSALTQSATIRTKSGSEREFKRLGNSLDITCSEAS